MWDPYAGFTSVVLPNGLTVYVLQWPERSWEYIGMMVHSGAESDTIGLEGVAHFLEHMTIDDSESRRKKFKRFIDDVGGKIFFGSTNMRSRNAYFFVPSKKDVIQEALSFFGHMFISLEIKNNLEEQRKVILGEFHRSYPAAFMYDLYMRKNKALYSGSGHFLERALVPLGNPGSISRIGLSDLQTYYDKYYVPANMSIVCVGGLGLDELVELIYGSPFALKREGQRQPLLVRSTDEPLPSENRFVFHMSEQFKEERKVGSYGSASKLPGSLDYEALNILEQMLDEILSEEIREKRNWSYHSECSRFRFNSFYSFSIECQALAIDAMDKIEEVVETCLSKVAESEDLFNCYKRRAIAGIELQDLNGKNVCLMSLNDLSSFHRIDSLVSDQNHIRQVTMDNVREILKWLRPERRYTLISLP